ncbi:calcium-binding mitochondrial carrier protein SCaMC-2-like isoform X1 [Sipha flava]|uniref:Calcium-binding mitochondrial carrier protein SCaMC-1 n=1 Tax=Sipha flava TaxID=143950 RepID=A0A2S2Q3Q4_9HEMI|nr:calcium-binding mitochondrial carrier protein SCaMC-2-like isoform X1 [Sipha flava]
MVNAVNHHVPVGPGSTESVLPPHYLHELPNEDEIRLAKLFDSLDFDKNGKIDIHDLSIALNDKEYAQKFLELSDATKSGSITLAEFIHYVKEHEKSLRLSFSNIDKNKDGKIDRYELIRAFQELGIEVDDAEAIKLLKRMDKDGSLEISFEEWRDFLLYCPFTDLHELIKYWRHSTYLDIGEDMNVPDDFTQAEMITGMWWRHLVSGGVAGAVSRTFTAPLDRLKVFLQVYGNQHSNITTCFKNMLKEGGKRGMWRGNGINVLKIAPESAFKFMAYEQAKRLIRGSRTKDLTIFERFMAGSLAGGFSQSLIYPLEVLKTRLAIRKSNQYKGIFDCIQIMYYREGMRSFYRGYVPNLLGILPYAGIDLAVYETLKNNYIASHNNGEKPGMPLLLACGTVSSTCGQVCSYPLALVRTRLQAPCLEGPDTRTMMSVFREIWLKEGVAGLYRGITPNFMKVAPAVSISYVVYERCREALGVTMS